MKFTTEPAMIVGAIMATLVLLISFGIGITPEQQAAIKGWSEAVLILIGAYMIRQSVTSNKALDTVGIAKKDVTRALNNETVISGGTGTGPGK